MIHQFSSSKEKKLSTTIIFNILEGHEQTLLQYLAQFNKEIIKVAHPNQEILVGELHNDLKVIHFNES